MAISGYDVIGDVHGCAQTLEKLLQKMGYEQRGGIYAHPSRLAIFVGDIVDRGPRIRESLHMIKNMVDQGFAHCVMGNHEYNALAYTTLAPESAGTQYVREHNSHNNRLIAETLTQFAMYPEEWRMFLEWFQSMPLFLELPGFRVVHACWDEALIKQYKAQYGTNRVSPEFIQESALEDSFACQFIDRLTRGTGIHLPHGRTIKSKDGYERDFFRTKFWAVNPEYYKDVVFQPDPLPEDLVDQPLSEEEKSSLLSYGEDKLPVFVGHYWLQGRPRPLRANVTCLDYSAVKYGRLAAYRYDGESELDESKYEWVYVDPDTDMDA